GSRVEQLGVVLQASVQAFRADRFGPNPPPDLLQNVHTPRRLAAGELTTADVADSWRAQLPARGLDERETVDWLLWWDNGLLPVLRERFPHASVLLALRDPRDMLLDWLAFGAPAQLRIASPKAAAGWLSIGLNQLAQLHEDDLFPHHLVKLDEIVMDTPALVAAVSEVLRTPLPELPAAALGPARFPPGHWRHYAEALAEPFAMLGPVAKRLGYPEA
ncbi:MAG: adenylate cyclase, partial [Luteimonas sp.]|nr:adenylate cyclase [Luteimonas sp.]